MTKEMKEGKKMINDFSFLALFFLYIVPDIIAYEIERGSCWFTNNSFTHALNPVLFIYCKERRNLQYASLTATNTPNDQRY